MRIWTDGTEWYVANDLDDLIKCFKEHNGYTYEQMCGEAPEENFTIVDGSKTFRMHFPHTDLHEAVKDSPADAAQVFSSANEYPVMEATFDAWAKKRGRGFLASVEF